ncbi:FliH/SctL family protein [Proteiniclasticum ruminis]|uniref:Flagellar biosynthesis/type III secretory pathway protein FliH n=1 Tax=Proteiniclasticum ruminis TaxID=398199 RepID=A0A1G8HZ92_9CLOT|nr:FliH/SctL family protein [Proteiniclasticum ruminis]SDI12006.1 Flagellar biosynthesis/type III secretory pathway protein FliH [Proteiniclasticum ruminis]
MKSSLEEVIPIALSYRIIKNTEPLEEKKLTSLDLSQYMEKTEALKQDEIRKIIKREDPMDVVKREIRKNLEEEIEIKKNAMLEKARQDLQKERERVLEEARNEGIEEGVRLGRESAYQEAESIRQEALSYLEEAEKAAKDYLFENEERILRLSAKIAEKILEKVIKESEEDVMLLARPVLQEYGKVQNVIISCNPCKVDQVKRYVPEMEKTCPNAHILILPDKALGELDIRVENEHQITDLSIRKQLDRFIALALG